MFEGHCMILKKTIKAMLMILCSTMYLVADESLNHRSKAVEIIGSIGESNFMHACSENIQIKMDVMITPSIMKLGHEPASQKYQDLGMQAQLAVGIPQKICLSIKKVDQASPIALLIGAVAESDAIYVNEEKLDKRIYGAVSCALHHEAVHVKYHDKMADSLLELIMLTCGTIGVFFVLKSFNVVAWRKTLSLMTALGLNLCTSNGYHHFMERRADIEGHYATQCALCVREHAQVRKELFEVENSPLKDNGYLWACDLEKIAQDLGDKKCAYHSDQLQS